ncbi:DUF1266 domain-containing protein [Streptomyces sp. cf386]|uniref:DUF1266 domain-containing protein n=1 Tax=Streptomyces sp. cf386 TaxID=1761904 RepID=UPI003524CFEE
MKPSGTLRASSVSSPATRPACAPRHPQRGRVPHLRRRLGPRPSLLHGALGPEHWQDFSAGFILGRCLHFDNDKFGSWYQDMVAVRRILMSDPGSPWLNIPFR